MTSLVYGALDAQVIAGRADELALDDGTVSLTYAQLLAEVAALAGGLSRLGVRAGSSVSLELEAAYEVLAVLACARLGAVVDPGAPVRVAGDPPVVHTGSDEVGWETVLGIGRTDPEAAPAADAPGYAERFSAAHASIFTTLASGRAIR